MTHVINLEHEERVELVLPDGRKIAIDYFVPDTHSLPEIEIWLPGDMTANCYADELRPAPSIAPAGEAEHIRIVQQIVIPITPVV